jgi:DNA primase
LKYGRYYLQNDQPLWQYLLDEINDIEFHTPVYKQILDLYQQALSDTEATADADYLLAYGTPEIKAMIAHLLFERYQISQHWAEKHQIYVPTERDILPKAIYTNILRLKLRIVEKMIHDNLQALQTPVDEAKETELLTHHISLLQYKTEIANLLGSVISGWH